MNSNEILREKHVILLIALVLILTSIFTLFLTEKFVTPNPKITGNTVTDVTGNLVSDVTGKIIDITGQPTAGTFLEITTESLGTYPNLTSNISSQTFAEDNNISINLSAHFTNPQGDTLNFTYSSIENFTIIINNDTGIVNITPDKDFNGTREIIFTAYNGPYGTDTNIIILNVTSVIDINIDTFDGATTSIDTYTEAQLSSIPNLILEKTASAKVDYQETISITRDINFDNIYTISQSHVQVDPTLYPELDKSAILSFYGITFTDPQILLDGSPCASATCQIINYTSNTLIIDVPSFGNFVIRETPIFVPSPVVSSAGAGGGGGGGGAGGYSEYEPPEFIIDTTTLEATLKQGENKREIITIKNIGNQILDFDINTTSLSRFLELSEYEFTLRPNQTRIISITFFIKEDEPVRFYKDKILITADRKTQKIDATIDIQSKTLSELETWDLFRVPIIQLPRVIFEFRTLFIISVAMIFVILFLLILYKKRKKDYRI